MTGKALGIRPKQRVFAAQADGTAQAKSISVTNWLFKQKGTYMRLTRWQRPELSVWDPFTRLSTLRDEIDRLFDSPLSALSETTQPFLSGWLRGLAQGGER